MEIKRRFCGLLALAFHPSSSQVYIWSKISVIPHLPSLENMQFRYYNVDMTKDDSSFTLKVLEMLWRPEEDGAYTLIVSQDTAMSTTNDDQLLEQYRILKTPPLIHMHSIE